MFQLYTKFLLRSPTLVDPGTDTLIVRHGYLAILLQRPDRRHSILRLVFYRFGAMRYDNLDLIVFFAIHILQFFIVRLPTS